jgi:hypothetical protein
MQTQRLRLREESLERNVAMSTIASVVSLLPLFFTRAGKKVPLLTTSAKMFTNLISFPVPADVVL